MALKIKHTTNNTAQYRITKHRDGSTEEIDISPALLKEALRISKASYAPTIPEKWIENLISNNNLLLIASKIDTMVKVGFASSQYEGKEYCLSSAAIVKSAQGQGLYYMMNRLRIKDGLSKGFNIFTALTQNPKVEKGIDYAMETLREEGVIAGYTITRELIRRCYRRMLTAEMPKSSNERVNHAFSMLNYQKGDAFNITFSVKRRRFGII